MNDMEKSTACHLLDNHYRLIKEVPEKEQYGQLAYYEGMKTMIEELLLGSEYCLYMDNNGIHYIEYEDIPF